MSDQLHHLLRMSVRSYLTLQVVPAALGAYTAMTGAFTLMEFAEFKPVAYTALCRSASPGDRRFIRVFTP